jgi:hypothetical protein
MSLELLSYDYIGRFATSAATIAGTMLAIRTGFESTTYSDGSARTPGSGIAWTAAAETSSGSTISLSLTPVTSTLGQKIIVTGGGSGTPTMISPDTYANTRIYIGLCKNAGAYTSWTSANPFTSGQYSGLTGFTLAVTAVHIYESTDSVVLVGETSAGAIYLAMAGALVDPESTDPAVAESDGKRYCIFTTNTSGAGGTPHNYANFGANSFLNHSAAGLFAAHSYIMNVGASTLTGVIRNNVTLNGSGASAFKNAAGEFVRLPIYIQGLSTSNLWFGRVREVLTFTQGLMGTRLTSSSVTKGFVLGPNTSSTGECILLRKS